MVGSLLLQLTSPAAEAGKAVPAASTFVPSLDPGGHRAFSHWELISLRPDGDKASIFDATGKLTIIGRYLDDLARDARNMRVHLRYVFSDASGNWELIDAPRYHGTAMKDQSSVHRMLRAVGSYTELIRGAADVPASFKEGLMTEAWREGVEHAFTEMINGDGLLASGQNTCDMAQCFHLLRTGLESARLRPDHVWTLPQAQRLVRTLLTAPHIINPVDAWLAASESYLAQCRAQNKKTPEDPVLIESGRVFFTGGLFIGWKAMRPSLHATWDGLSIINTLTKYYPEPDAANPASIFYLWGQESEETKAPMRVMMATLRKKLWENWRDHRGATYCFVANGGPVDTTEKPTTASEAPTIVDHAGYPIAEFWHWSYLSQAEMFGHPPRNTNEGVQRLIALTDRRFFTN